MPEQPPDLDELIARVPPGWSRLLVDGAAWGVTRTEHAGGRTITLEAEQLGGRGRVSANLWRTSSGTLLRPCEMPAEQVLDFLEHLPRADQGDPPRSAQPRPA